MKNSFKVLKGLFVTTAVLFTFICICSAQAPKKGAQTPAEEPEYTVENINGEVAGITQDNISIIYNRNYDTGAEYEMLIPIGKNTVLKHKTNLKEIKEGDLVNVEFEKPKPASKKKGVARTITFIQSAVPVIETQPYQEEQPADSGTQE